MFAPGKDGAGAARGAPEAVGGRRGLPAGAYFLATTMVLIVACTPSTTSTTTM